MKVYKNKIRNKSKGGNRKEKVGGRGREGEDEG